MPGPLEEAVAAPSFPGPISALGAAKAHHDLGSSGARTAEMAAAASHVLGTMGSGDTAVAGGDEMERRPRGPLGGTTAEKPGPRLRAEEPSGGGGGAPGRGNLAPGSSPAAPDARGLLPRPPRCQGTGTGTGTPCPPRGGGRPPPAAKAPQPPPLLPRGHPIRKCKFCFGWLPVPARKAAPAARAARARGCQRVPGRGRAARQGPARCSAPRRSTARAGARAGPRREAEVQLPPPAWRCQGRRLRENPGWHRGGGRSGGGKGTCEKARWRGVKGRPKGALRSRRRPLRRGLSGPRRAARAGAALSRGAFAASAPLPPRETSRRSGPLAGSSGGGVSRRQPGAGGFAAAS
ncbi:cytosolic arginine sensor for mTORC1 subunit 1 isoform X1 [Struthio camelus]|uniref:cytosolic arginine sensor for mTORC1 subunit 1 isoform X1 n=1 Tax=Struthio camelus TaxID=8801 RepID=UPI0036040AB9